MSQDWRPEGQGGPPFGTPHPPPGTTPPYQDPGHGPSGYPSPHQPYPPQGPPYGYGPAPRPTNGLAVASMVLGILWLYWLGSILALIFGYIARSQIRASYHAQQGMGMAIAGIVLGWVGVATLVAFILFLVAFATSAPLR